MFKPTKAAQQNWILKRIGLPCRFCNSRKSDPVSLMCKKCIGQWRIHGSPTVKKPKLRAEMDKARKILSPYKFEEAEWMFNNWLKEFVSTRRNDPLRRLVDLHFHGLQTKCGEPLMSLFEAMVQTMAVKFYEDGGGELDNGRNQYQYLMGRAAIAPWGRIRQAANGTVYDKSFRIRTQRQPSLFHRAHKEIFVNSGICNLLARVLHHIKTGEKT